MGFITSHDDPAAALLAHAIAKSSNGGGKA